MGDEFDYRPQGFSEDPSVLLHVGGWQIKKSQNVWGYKEVVYWDTIGSQSNGIGAKGPWIIWGGWNGGASLDYVNNYKFVVSDQGNVYAQRFYDNGQQLLPMVIETIHTTTTGNYCTLSKPGYFLIECNLISNSGAYYVTGINNQTNENYAVIISGTNNTAVDLYVVWCKKPD